MKLLLIDVGNSNIVTGINEAGHWLYNWRMHTVSDKTADEYEVILRSLFDKNRLDPKSIDKVVLSSVVPSLLHPMQEMVYKLTGRELYIINPDLYPNLPVNVINPYEIGGDIVADAVAAYEKYPGNRIIIDFGTAMTFTTIDAGGNILGVSITPGMKTAISSLVTHTAQLPDVPLKAPPSILGKNTVHAVQSGVVYGYVGMIEYMIRNIRNELSGPVTVIATGGLAYVMDGLTDVFDSVDPVLTMEGLRLIGERYV
ncbi:MAG: type III pantothenate kinase [Bacteroidales bacterium]|nr:type III pantothenate kinase [Bacteroidales bacterium]MCF8334525.1 type III pantothenate kinase [Bacteroidales bacterium]